MSSFPLIVHPDQQRALEALAVVERCSPEVLVHDALDGFIRIKQEQSSIRSLLTPEEDEALTREAEESWKHYKETGLHLTHDEVGDWILRLNTDPNAKLPPCHT